MAPVDIILILYGITAIIFGGLVVYTWSLRHEHLTRYFLGVCAFSFIAIISETFKLLVSSFDAKADWLKISHFNESLLAIFWWLLVLEYIGWQRYTRPKFIALYTLPVLLTLVVGIIPSTAHLYFDGLRDMGDGFVVPRRGIFSLIRIVYLYLLIMGISILAIRKFLHANDYFRKQAFLVALAPLPVIIGSLVYIVGLLPKIDLTIPSLGLSGMLLAWGLFRYRLLDLVPIARDKIIMSIDVGVLTLNTRNEIVDINQAAALILGAGKPELLIGKSIANLVANRPDLLEKYLSVTEARTEISGGGRYFDMSISPLTNTNGKIVGRTVILYDITERKTIELEQNRLIEQLEAFSHTVAHDLKDPLNTVIGYAQLIDTQNATLPDKLRNYNVSIINSGRKMVTIIEELLKLAEIRYRHDIPLTPLDMPTIIEQVKTRLHNTLGQYPHAEIVLPTTWEQGIGYAPWIEEVLANYISNALKYGGTPPRVELGSEISNGQVRYWVRDNGKGLSIEAQEQLFGTFSRVGETQIKGHGLGLSIVKRIVETLGGQVGVDSQPDQGSTFYFTLPLATTAQPGIQVA